MGCSTPLRATWRLATPPVGGAIAVIEVRGDVSGALARLGIAPVGRGEIRLRDLAGIDAGVVARWDESMAHLMPHAGPAVLAALADALDRAGVAHAGAIPARAAYPEGADVYEALMLDALARAHSPLGVDLLLDQPRRWRAAGAPDPGGVPDDARSRALRRLIEPPLVVAIGAPNIGKSTLVNALAGRGVSLVADEPGTTRDYVGVMLDIGGLVVRYADTPGLRALGGPGSPAAAADELERAAASMAVELAARADLVLACHDATSEPVPVPAGVPVLRVRLRDDLGPGAHAADASVSVLRGRGLEGLVGAIVERLIPAAWRSDPSPWRFW